MNTPEIHGATSAPSPTTRRNVVAALIGNALEWYDFIIYGFMAQVIATVFFPSDGNRYVSLLLTTAVFGAGFVMRPVGGILLGIYADKRGRKPALQMIMYLMSAAILMITFAPPYAAIGIGAPVIILIARLLQGAATGGEFASATSFLTELAPPGKKGFYASWQFFGQFLAVLVGSSMAALLNRSLTPESLESWGWRVAFLAGLAIAPVAIWMRRHLEETPVFLEAEQQAPTQTFTESLKSNYRGILVSFLLNVPGTAVFYVVLVNMPGYVSKQFGIPADQSFTIQMIAVLWLVILTPTIGWFSDKVSKRAFLTFAYGGLLLSIYPMMQWLGESPSTARLLVMQIVLCTFHAIVCGVLAPAMAEQLPVRVRSTGMTIGYNLAVMVFGGFAPFTLVWLTQATGSSFAPAFYLMVCAPIGLLGCAFMKGRKREAHSLSPASEHTQSQINRHAVSK
ncbi:MFS transporter [Pandoraea sp. ISTKB]|uniref:MFS transporter n=1 Tax=Pandoraea sp. ISTKB TaxID=1586708 RepID=UPI000AAD6F73|nr:MFS transporter [Pandoraea sp. ISTKB]